MMKKVLIVEDDRINLSVLVKFLENNFILKAVSDSTRALDVYNDFKPDILITDIDMPGLNGIELSKKIRKLDKNIKIIILTGHDDINYVLNAVELNLTKYLIKPVTKESIDDALKLAIDDINSYKVVDKRKLKISDDLYWNYETKVLTYKNEEIKLTKNEIIFMDILASNPNQAKKYDEIGVVIWNDKYYVEEVKGPLKTLIHSLKNKLPQTVIKNVSGIGYKLEIL